MSLASVSNTFLGLVGVGTGGPAVALVLGFPETVIKGLGGRPAANWSASPEAKFGLFLYTVSDICLAVLCGASLVGSTSTTLALGATAVHQFSYLAAAIPSIGYCKEQWGSIIFGAIAGILSVANANPT